MTNKKTIIGNTSLPENNTAIAEPISIHRPGQHSLTEPSTIIDATSEAFDSKHALNPLIGAAAPLIMAVGKIKSQTYQASPTLLFNALVKEIKTFEEKARKLQYRSAIILAARYFLCSFVDEIAASSAEPIQKLWQQKTLLQTLQGEPWGGERFFMILERASDDPKSHIDLLELGFLCLNLGYQGKYLNKTPEQRELEHLKDNLFTIINKERDNKERSLFIAPSSSAQTPLINQKRRMKIPHLTIASVILVTGLLAVYIPYHSLLSDLAKPIHTTLKKMANNTNLGTDKSND